MYEGVESCSIRCPAGMGKTSMIFILSAKYLQEGKAFAIVVANDLLYS
jgi:reverse gyrase